jgi:hypothetical protein
VEEIEIGNRELHKLCESIDGSLLSNKMREKEDLLDQDRMLLESKIK